MKRIGPAAPSAADLDAVHSAAAVLTVHKAGHMDKRGRRRIANWLRAQADMIEVEGAKYAPRFRARYLYPKG